MSKIVRILALAEAGVLGFFAFFLVELSANDQFFNAWLNQNFFGPYSLDLFLLAIGGLVSNSVFYAVRPAAVPNVVNHVGVPTVTGPPPPAPSLSETKIVVPEKSALARYIEGKSSQYSLVNQDGSPVQKVPVPRDRKTGNGTD